ncbi:Short-chain dehydrogenase/reductase SDR [Macleaya cordata]|uniref:Short-chain dehydrogenase/reductase SDR n=1 Tax=Macleaya cordata TaxID=56857 RepID=A0A200QV89_MACCD|nr:Short-chain dehydrogenase/reductase SDR [Macleaya cordata]
MQARVQSDSKCNPGLRVVLWVVEARWKGIMASSAVVVFSYCFREVNFSADSGQEGSHMAFGQLEMIGGVCGANLVGMTTIKYDGHSIDTGPMGIWSWFLRSGSSGFGSSSTAEQVTDVIDATGLTAIVTGATSGIGKETARVLALRGAKVIIPSRDLENGLKTKESLLLENPKAKLDVMEMDLSSINSITSFARSFNSSNPRLNILINNAGIMACPFQLSLDGIELQYATNHLGHFLLTNLLLDKLKTTAKETGIEGRIINVSSSAHRRYSKNSSINDLKIINHPIKYKGYDAYCRSKLANILHANELARVLQEEGANVTANSLHPGLIPTNISRYINLKGFPFPVLKTLLKPIVKSIPQGASTTCYLALHPDLKGVTGKYFANCNESPPSSQAQDMDLGKKLWDFSLDLLNNLNNKPNNKK